MRWLNITIGAVLGGLLGITASFLTDFFLLDCPMVDKSMYRLSCDLASDNFPMQYQFRAHLLYLQYFSLFWLVREAPQEQGWLGWNGCMTAGAFLGASSVYAAGQLRARLQAKKLPTLF